MRNFTHLLKKGVHLGALVALTLASLLPARSSSTLYGSDDFLGPRSAHADVPAPSDGGCESSCNDIGDGSCSNCCGSACTGDGSDGSGSDGSGDGCG